MEDLETPYLVECVKYVQRNGIKGPGDIDWKAFVQGLPAAQRHNDPHRQSREQLLAFLKLIAQADPQHAKLLKRYATWSKAVREEEAAAKLEAAAAMQQEQEDSSSSGTGSSSSAAAAWRLVERTRAHPKFARIYSFPSWEKGWIRTSRLRTSSADCSGAAAVAGSNAAAAVKHAPRLLGVDCEMCETSKNNNALLSVAVVDESGAVIIRELVKPSGKTLDLRTHITGITQEQLKGVKTRRKDVAQLLAQMLGPDTILVGHSLSADLRALQLDHQPVIDTALLYSYKGLSAATPSLVHLAQQLLGQTLRSGHNHIPSDAAAAAAAAASAIASASSAAAPAAAKGTSKAAAAGANREAVAAAVGGEGVHDSREDACAAISLVQYELKCEKAGRPTGPLDPPVIMVPKEDLCKLLVHSIPDSAASPQLSISHAFGKAGAPAPVSIQPGSNRHQLLLVFSNAAVANEAFSALPGSYDTDSIGRHRKQLELPGGVKVCVRKMACHAGTAFGRDAPKDRGLPKQGKKKRKDKNKNKQQQQQQRQTQQKGKEPPPPQQQQQQQQQGNQQGKQQDKAPLGKGQHQVEGQQQQQQQQQQVPAANGAATPGKKRRHQEKGSGEQQTAAEGVGADAGAAKKSGTASTIAVEAAAAGGVAVGAGEGSSRAEKRRKKSRG